ncbi:hypothetical protein OBBRIDRAFT_740814 [Obba rivulosa]|uniref:Uncharacterized protein n=1 Tax=Obba rivulosa TaxID=1052685 RepID=A0A8E2AQJ7_9APHY|nr:hypothetical protein OBBRIDRAFT_740814 [Obba rivulosa]
MNTVNTSVGYSPFQLRFSQSLYTILPILPDAKLMTLYELNARSLIQHLESYVHNEQDNLLVAKVRQAASANAK